jgi:hypothetical protein
MNKFVDQIDEEIRGVSELVTLRRKHSPEPAVQLLIASMGAALATKVLQLKYFDTKGAHQLELALHESIFPKEMIEQVSNAIDSRLCSATAINAKSNGVKSQHLLHVNAYLTKLDWNVLTDPSVKLMAKTHAIIHRLNRCGCTHASEQTIKWVVAVLALVAFPNFPSYKSIYTMVQDCKDVVESLRQPFGFAHIVDFPDRPSMLPPNVFESAYDAGDPPVENNLPGYETTGMHHVPLRSSSKLLKETSAANTMDSMITAVVHRMRDELGGRGPPSPDLNIMMTPQSSTKRGYKRASTCHSLMDDGEDAAGIRQRVVDMHGSSSSSVADQGYAWVAIRPAAQAIEANASPLADQGYGRFGTLASSMMTSGCRNNQAAHVLERRVEPAAAIGSEVVAIGHVPGSTRVLRELGDVSELEPAEEAGEDDEEDDDEAIDYERETLDALKKRPSCKKPSAALKKPAAAEEPAAPKVHAAVKAKGVLKKPAGAGMLKPPTFSCEWTRNQVLRRPNNGEPSIALKFADHGGVDGAVKAAQKWLVKQRKLSSI